MRDNDLYIPNFKTLLISLIIVLSFINNFVSEYLFALILFSFISLIYYGKHVPYKNSFFVIILLCLIFPIIQFFISGYYNFKANLNFLGFIFIIFGISTFIYSIKYDDIFRINFYLEKIVLSIVALYVLTPLISHGIYDFFSIDRNYLYATGNNLLPDNILDKQKTSALINFCLIIIFFKLKNSRNLIYKLILIIIFILGLNLLIGSRSQIIGTTIALIMLSSGNNVYRIKIYSILFSVLFLTAIFIMTSDIFLQFSNIDIRFMLFHAASVTFLSNIISGIGLYTLPQFLDANNQDYLFSFGGLFPSAWGPLLSFPTGFESSFLQFSVELGFVWLFILYWAIKSLLTLFYNIDYRFKYFGFFCLAYFFSSITEDNLTQPTAYILLAVILGLLANRQKSSHNFDASFPEMRNSPP
jgi:hypothetical protein